MKFKLTILPIALYMITNAAHAADQGQGKVTFTGTIIDAPCSIAPESVDQTVSLGQIANKSLLNGGKSKPTYFAIKLENCDVSSLTNKTVTATFTGQKSTANPNNLALTGSASGASIVLSTEGGQDIKLGQPTPGLMLQNSNATMNFAAYLVGDPASKDGTSTIVPGEFSSVANFILSYQ
ncbi:fimbrial protein [uncultured Pantoea sp.]|uniref:fimbrial protein n=1 Tax=uncultured Pantoea sp. TaxID=218084 RepID=UPI0028062B10|nr:fimbrial protein [uncultured Pantoea sp.]